MTKMEGTYSHSPEFKKKFGERLRTLRKEQGYSSKEILVLLNLTHSTYNGWELGYRIPLSKSISGLAEFYDVSIDYLMLKTDNRKKEQDLKEMLQSNSEWTWEGNKISKNQIPTIIALIDAYMSQQ